MPRPVETTRKPYKGKLVANVVMRGVPLPPERVEEWKRAMLWFYGFDQPGETVSANFAQTEADENLAA